MLPINDDGDIDFAFMSAFMRDVEKDILGTTLRTFENRLNVYDNIALPLKFWKQDPKSQGNQHRIEN